jgi:hypothetical protein
MQRSTKIIFFSVGLGLAGFAAYSCWQRTQEPPIYVAKKIGGGYNAKTIPPFGIWIAENERNNEALLAHELVHWQQFQAQGLLPFYWNYWQQIQQFGYDDAPMEIEARKNETLFCQTNYTQCVREGRAKTVFNPNFRSS